MTELNLLFATNFSDSCFRAIRAIAQLADTFDVRLTVAHAEDSAAPRHRDLHSFFAEADHFAQCRRITLQGAPAAALTEFSRSEHFDLIIAPGSDRLGLPRPFHRSIRAELLRSATAPVWTTSRGLEAADFRRPIRTVAVVLNGASTNLQHLNLAESFASRIGASLRILTVVPEISEATLNQQAVAPQPLHPDRALARIEALLQNWHRSPSIEIAIGSPGREIPRLAARSDADLLFLSEEQSTGGFFFREINRLVSHSPCAVVIVPEALPARFQWSFQTAIPVPATALLETAFV